MIAVHLNNKKNSLDLPKKFLFKNNRIQIGKHNHNHIQIDHEKAEFFQCELFSEDNSWWVANFNHKIPVFLNVGRQRNCEHIKLVQFLEY